MTEQQNIPKHWEIKKLGEVCQVLDNLRKPINSTERQKRISGKNQNELFPYYGATGQVGWIDDYITEGTYILIGEDGAPFLDIFKDKAYKVVGKTWVNNHAHIIKGKENILQDDFALYYLNSINYREFVNGTTRLKLTKSSLIDIPFVIPPLQEQQAIVAKIEELLSDLENGKQQLLKAQQQLKVYRQSLLKWAFEGKLTNKDVNEGELPKDWKWVKLGEILLSVKNGSGNKPDDEGKKKILRISAVRPNSVSLSDVRFLKNDLPVDYEVYENDLLFTRYNGSKDYVGVCGRVPFLNEKLFYPDKLIRCRTIIKDNYHSKYLQFASNCGEARKFIISKLKTTAGQTGIAGSEIKQIPIPLAPLKEQQRIVEILESKLTVCDKLEETISQNLAQSETLRQSILKRAFEGRLV